MSVTGTANNAAVDTTVFAPYTGAGTFKIDVDTNTGFSSAFSGGQVTVTQATDASVTASVIYTYSVPSSTPEPATMFLMGSALVGVGLLRRRMKP